MYSREKQKAIKDHVLCQAYEKGHFELVKKYLNKDNHLVTDDNDDNLILLAARKYDWKAVFYFLSFIEKFYDPGKKEYSNLNFRECLGKVMFHWINNEYMPYYDNEVKRWPFIQRLLALNATTRGGVCAAAKRNFKYILAQLLDAGASSKASFNDKHPLTWAAEAGHDDVIDILLNHKSKKYLDTLIFAIECLTDKNSHFSCLPEDVLKLVCSYSRLFPKNTFMACLADVSNNLFRINNLLTLISTACVLQANEIRELKTIKPRFKRYKHADKAPVLFGHLHSILESQDSTRDKARKIEKKVFDFQNKLNSGNIKLLKKFHLFQSSSIINPGNKHSEHPASHSLKIKHNGL